MKPFEITYSISNTTNTTTIYANDSNTAINILKNDLGFLDIIDIKMNP